MADDGPAEDVDPEGDPPVPAPPAFGVPGNAAPGHDWFGHPIREDGRGAPFEPVPCPLCGEPFTKAAALEVHVRREHGVDPDPGRVPRVAPRLKRWGIGLKFLPLWFVLPVNLALTLLLILAWGKDAALFSTSGDQTAVVHAWIIRFSILPSILVLVWRAVDRPV